MAVEKVVRTRKSGKKTVRFRARVYVNGVRVASMMHDTMSAAKEWERQTLRMYERHEGVPVLTFSELVTMYYEKRVPQLKHSTRQALEIRRKCFMQTAIDSCLVSDIGAIEVDHWISWMLRQPTAKDSGRKSFKKELSIMAAMLSWYREYIDAKFVVPIVKRHREAVRYKPVAKRRPDYFMRPDEVRSWLDALLMQHTSLYHDLGSFMVLTGARVGEACGLKWSDVDFDLGIARIVRTMHWCQKTKRPILDRDDDRPKTESSVRIIPLPETLLTRLKERKAKARSVYVFCNDKGQPPTYSSIQNGFNRGFLKAGLPWRSTHICRHTNSTLMLMATKDKAAVQANLGHTTATQTDQYAKVIAALNRGNSEKTAALILGDHPKNHPQAFEGF